MNRIATRAALIGASMLTSAASGQVLGLMATSRLQSDGNYLVNVWVVAGASTNTLTSVCGCQIGSITTNAFGGFRQGAGTQGVWAPAGSQNWNTLDSFLTVGGSLNTTTGVWTANGNTQGDPPWNVNYFDTDLGKTVSVNAFNTPSNASGFENRLTNNVPTYGGWFIAGTSSPARNLAGLTGRTYSSSEAAASSNAGMMVAQLYVSELSIAGGRELGKVIEWKMSATVRRLDGSTSNASFQFVIGEVPAPGALAILGLAGLAARRRRA